MARCSVCGQFDGLSYECNYCEASHCSAHRLPENHHCHALGATSYKDQNTTEKAGASADRRRNHPRRRERNHNTTDIGVVSKTTSAMAAAFSAVFSKRAVALALGLVITVGAVSGTVGTGVKTIDSAVDDGESGADSVLSNVSNETQTPNPVQLSTEEIKTAVHQATNRERARRGLSTLYHTDRLSDIAQYHSKDMANGGYLSHESPNGETMADRYDRFGYDCRVKKGANTYSTGAENIAYTIATTGNETAVGYGIVEQWMGSPDHRETLLKDYWNNEGVGVVVTETDDGTAVYTTQNFC